MEYNKRGRTVVEKNSINILETIKKEKNNDLIIFTTFVFDPIFFDGYILRKLKQNNPNATIIVLMDDKIYSTLHSEFTNDTGIEYALIPISGNLFHSKIFVFKSKSQSHVLVGSHNLTLSGITQNLELSFDSRDVNLVSDCLEYIASLLRKNIDSKNPWYKRIEPFLLNTRYSSLITNENEPILDQTLNLVKKQTKKINEIIVFAPYFSKVEQIVKKLLDLNPKEIKICIQKDNHNLETKNLDDFSSVSLNELIPNNIRRLHSKFIIFRSSEKDLILMGSPNFTSPALLKTSNDGNYESALLLEDNYEQFSKNFKVVSITKKDVKDTKRTILDIVENFQIPQIIINFAYFDDFGRLNVEYNSKITDDVIVTLFNETEEITKDIRIESGMHVTSIHSIPKTVNEIMISKNNKIFSNHVRVCSPKGMKIRTGFEIEDSKSVQKALSEVVDLEDIANLCFAVFSSHDEKIGDYDHISTQERVPMPAKRTSMNPSLGIFDILNKLFRLSKRQTTKHATSEIKAGQKHGHEIKEIDDLISELIQKLTKKFENEISLKTTFTKRYSVYLVIALKLIKKINTGKTRGISSVSAISGLNNMIANDSSFAVLESEEKMEVLYLLMNLAKEAQENLNIPYKFDDEAILSEFQLLILEYLKKYNPIQDLFEKLKLLQKYGFDNLEDVDKSLLTEFFEEELVRLPIPKRLEMCKKIAHTLDHETNYEKITSGYSALKLFLEKDSELRDRMSYEIKSFESKQNIDAIKKIISEYS